MKKFKDIKAIKTNPEPAKGKNVDPDQLGQYSAKYQVSESTASLNQYLSARGINPQFVSTATKIAHSKSAQFLKWKQDHMQRREDVQASELTPEETVNEVRMDQISPAMQAHVKKGRVGSLNVGTRMSSPKPAFKPKPKPKKVGFFKRLFAGEEVQLEASKASKPTALERFRAAAAVREKKHNDIEKERQERLHQEPSKSNVPDRETKKDYMSAAIDRLEKHLNNEEVEQIMNEMDTYPHPDSKEGKALMKAFKSSAKKDPTDLNAPGKSPTVKQTTSALLPMLNKSFKKSMKKEEVEQVNEKESAYEPSNDAITTDTLAGRMPGGKFNSFKSFKTRVSPFSKDSGQKPGDDTPEIIQPQDTPARKSHEVKEATIAGLSGFKRIKKDVTDKSGAVHTPMSRARDLAQQALKTVQNKTKVK
jgi:hypothetical protein